MKLPRHTMCSATLLAVLHAAGLSAQSQAEEGNRLFATQPGVGIGVLMGVDGVGDTSNAIRRGFGLDGFLRYGMPFGLYLRGGIHISSHDIEQTTSSYRTSGFYFEPRYFALRLASKWTPYFAGRIGVTRASVSQPGSQIYASGYVVAGGVGAAYMLAPQVAVEGGLSLGRIALGDYTFKGELAWYECLNQLEAGTPLTESVIRCDGASHGPQYNCYPPFHDRISGDCTPPEVPYAGTGRSQTWVRLALGLHISLASRK